MGSVQYQFFFKEIMQKEILPYLDYTNASEEREAAHQLLYVKHTQEGFISLDNEKIIFQNHSLKTEYTVNELGGPEKVLFDIFKIKHCDIQKLWTHFK